MPKKKTMKRSARATLTGVRKEMAKARVAKSARKKYANLDSSLPSNNPGKPRVGGEMETVFERGALKKYLD
jgi:hypothetical protein